MFTLDLRFWITSASVLILLIIADHNEAISFLYQTPHYLASLGFRLLSFLLAVILLMAFYGIGLLACSSIGLNIFPKQMGIPIKFFIGYLLASVAVYFLGFTKMLHKEIFFLVVLFGACISIHKIVLTAPYKFSHLKSLQKNNFEKWVIFCVGVFLLGRIFPILNFNSFGDPLFYNLPAGRDYLQAGEFKWLEHAEFYWQAGLSDIGQIYLHSLTSHPMMVQLTSQSFYFISGTLFLLYILHKGLFSKLVPEKHSLWITFSFIAMDTFRSESIVAKSDFWLAVLFCLIIVCLYEALTEENKEIRLQFFILIMLFSGLCLSIKATSILFLLPLCTGIFIFGSQILPWKFPSFWYFFLLALVLGLLNSAKNHYIFGNPIIPFAGNIFHSPYWDKEGLEGMQTLGKIEPGNYLDFPQVLFQFFLGQPTILLLVLATLIYWKQKRIMKIFPAPLLNLLKIMSLSWFGSLILWMFFLDAQVNTRYIIGFVFLTLLLPVIFTVHQLKPIFQLNHKIWQNLIGSISLLLTLSVSHIDVDFQQARHFISSKSFHKFWLDSSNLAEVQNYLNNTVNPKTRVLFHYTTQRFHSKFIVYGARSFSPRTRFVYSKDKNEIMERLKRIKPAYYVIRKDKIGITGGLLENKSFLDDNFELLKNFKEYFLYKVPNEFEIY